MMLSIVLVSNVGEPKYIQMLDQHYYQTYFNLSFKMIFPTIFIVFLTMSMLDHDQKAYQMMIAYRSRCYVLMTKWMVYLLWMTTILIIIYIFMSLWLMFMTSYYQDYMSLFNLLMHLWLDGTIFISCFMILNKKEHMNRGLIMILIYLIYPMLYEVIDSQLLYYLFPIYHIDIKEDMLVYLYKICYSVIGFIYSYAHHEKMPIY